MENNTPLGRTGKGIGQAQIGLTSGKIRMMVLLYDVIRSLCPTSNRMECYILTVAVWHELLDNKPLHWKGGGSIS